MNLPDIKQQFVEKYLNPVNRELKTAPFPERFDVAQQRYEDEHGHRLPISQRTVEGELARRR